MLCIFIFKNKCAYMFIRKKCCVQNKRVRRNFKIKKIDFLRVRENSEQS